MNRRNRRVRQAITQMRLGISFDVICDAYNLSKVEIEQIEHLEKREILPSGNIKIFR